MVKVPKDWERRLIELAAIHGVTDFLIQGRLTKAESKVFYAILNKIGRPAAVTATRGIGRIPSTARFLVMRHPYIATAAALYIGYQEREKIKAALDQGYEIVEEQLGPPIQQVLDITAPGRRELMETMQPRAAPFIPGAIERFRPKRKASAFNKAIKAGMLAVKKSPSYGGKGKISPAKKAFSVVVKLASAKKKKKKAPKSGIRRSIWNAMKGLR